ncbi:metallophosphoesterase [Parasediminibacterium sp. JCM 36343]|uniref:metallophosphoesterase n=1 Tax=Parasediminibacterium sp. JCM 36343 TaxID=3374279 RepID=UPI00397D4036
MPRNFFKPFAFICIAFLLLVLAFTIAPKPIVVNKQIQQASRVLPCFLVFSDIHLDLGNENQEIANQGNNTSNELWDRAKTKIANTIADQHPRFIIVLGDLPRHDAKKEAPSTASTRKEARTKVLADLKKLSEDYNTPLLFVQGNNDADTNYGRFSTTIFQDSSWPFLMAKNKVETRPKEARSLFNALGCYSAYPLGKGQKLRVIALNTVVFNKKYHKKWAEDATKELDWLNSQLADVKENNEQALLVMHIPPGTDGYADKGEYKPIWDASIDKGNDINNQDKFLNIIASFQDNIVGLLSSHSHMDGVRLLMDKSGAFASLISVPAIAPGHGNNPAFKAFTYNPYKKFQLHDFTTYYMPYWNDTAPEKAKLANWDSAYSFQAIFENKAGQSIFQRLKELREGNEASQKILKQDVKDIYAAKSKLINNNVNTDITIDVK